MPQIDSVTFMSQVFWLVIIFLYNYIFILVFLLPVITITLKMRDKEFKVYFNNIALFYKVILFTTINDNINIYYNIIKKEFLCVKTIVYNLLKLKKSLVISKYLTIKHKYIFLENKVDYIEKL